MEVAILDCRYYFTADGWKHSPSRIIRLLWHFPAGSDRENLPAVWETQVQSLGQEDPLEKGMATHSSVFLPGEFHEQRSLMGYSMGLQRTLVVVISWWLPHGWSRGRPFALPELSPFVGVGCVVSSVWWKIVHLEYVLRGCTWQWMELSKGWIVTCLLQAITVSKKHPTRFRVLETMGCIKEKVNFSTQREIKLKLRI